MSLWRSTLYIYMGSLSICIIFLFFFFPPFCIIDWQNGFPLATAITLYIVVSSCRGIIIATLCVYITQFWKRRACLTRLRRRRKKSSCWQSTNSLVSIRVVYMYRRSILIPSASRDRFQLLPGALFLAIRRADNFQIICAPYRNISNRWRASAFFDGQESFRAPSICRVVCVIPWGFTSYLHLVLLDELLLVWGVAGPIDFILINKNWRVAHFLLFSLFLRIFGWKSTVCARLPYQIGDQQEEEEEEREWKTKIKDCFNTRKAAGPTHRPKNNKQSSLFL